MRRIAVLAALCGFFIAGNASAQPMTKSQLNAYNNQYVNTNNARAITGAILNQALGQIITSMCGVAQTADCPLPGGTSSTNLWVSTVHDGVTDDSAAIAAVLALCGNANGYNTVNLGPYRYAVTTQTLTIPAGCTVTGAAGPVAPEVQDGSGDYTTVSPAFVMNPKMTIIDLGTLKNLYVLNGTALSGPPINVRGVLTEINKMSPANVAGATASVTVTASGFNGHAVFSWTGHGLAVGSPVYFSGTMPSGLFASDKQIYFVTAEDLGPNQFEISTQPGYPSINTGGNGVVTGTGGYVGVFQGLVGGTLGRDTVTDGVAIMGFNFGIYSSYGSRAVINNVSMDDNTCVFYEYSYDYATINNLRCNVNIANAVNATDQRYAISDVNVGAGGVCRIAVPSTTNILSGDPVFTATINGNASCNGGPWVASVIDSIHVDLIGSTYAGGTFTTANFSTSSQFLNNMPGMGGRVFLKSVANGTGIPANSIVQAIDYARGTVRLDNSTTAPGTGVTVTFTNPGGYSGTGGVLSQSIVWRPGAGLKVADSTGGSCNNCFINGHASGFEFDDGAFSQGVLDFLLTAPNIDTDGSIGPVNSYGIMIQGHSGYINVTNGTILGIGVPYYVNSVTSGVLSTLSNMVLGSVLSNGFGNGVLFDIVSGGVAMNTVAASQSGEAWVSKTATNTSICGFVGPSIQMLNEPTAPASLWSSHFCGNLVAGGNNN